MNEQDGIVLSFKSLQAELLSECVNRFSQIRKRIVTYLQGFFRVIRVLKNQQQMWQQIEVLLKSLGL